MYNVSKPIKRNFKGVDKYEGEHIETKVKRLTEDNEPIKDGAPLIYTDRSKGVIAAYNIRTDRFEIAAEAMDKIHASKAARAKDVADAGKTAEGGKVIDLPGDGNNGKSESGA